MDYLKRAMTHLSDACFILLVRTVVIASLPYLALRDEVARRRASRTTAMRELRDTPSYARR